MQLLRYLATAGGLAFDSIRAHKLRSFLTLLGVIIGVASVILVGAAIDGLGAYAEQITAKAFGTDSFLIAQVASVGRLTRKQIEALDLFDELANSPQLYLDMEFEPGDIQFLNNRAILHGRTDYEDAPEIATRRHMLRLWLQMPSWPLLPGSPTASSQLTCLSRR